MAETFPVPPPTTQQNPIESMVASIAGLLGQPDDPEVRRLAIECLDRAAAHMNGTGVYLTLHRDFTTTTFNNADRFLTLPNDWGWPACGYGLVYGPTLQLLGQIEWLSWQDFLSRQPSLNAQSNLSIGVPEIAAIRSELDNTVYLWPTIDSSRVGQITFPYYAHILRISEVADPADLRLNDEMREALRCGGEYYALMRRYKDRPAIYQPFLVTFTRAIVSAKATAQRYQMHLGNWARPGAI